MDSLHYHHLGIPTIKPQCYANVCSSHKSLGQKHEVSDPETSEDQENRSQATWSPRFPQPPADQLMESVNVIFVWFLLFAALFLPVPMLGYLPPGSSQGPANWASCFRSHLLLWSLQPLTHQSELPKAQVGSSVSLVPNPALAPGASQNKTQTPQPGTQHAWAPSFLPPFIHYLLNTCSFHHVPGTGLTTVDTEGQSPGAFSRGAESVVVSASQMLCKLRSLSANPVPGGQWRFPVQSHLPSPEEGMWESHNTQAGSEGTHGVQGQKQENMNSAVSL